MTAILDGFVVTAGDASGVLTTDRRGGGMLIEVGSPTVRNCIFCENRSDEQGGAVFVTTGSQPTFLNCVFSANAGFSGAALFVGSGPLSVVNCVFVGNTAQVSAGGIWTSGATTIFVSNSIFWGNSNDSNADETAQIGPTTSLANVSHCCIEGWTGDRGGVAIIADDPMFVDMDGLDDTLGTADDDLHVSLCSPLIDAGNNAPPGGIADPDIEGNPRISNGVIDIGVFEDPDAGGFPDTDGDSKPDFCDPCPLDSPDDTDGDGVCDSDDQCPGFDDQFDCDADGLPDGCEADCQPNGVPDDCEIYQDCNLNSIPDECELAANDCNANSVPDDCEPDCQPNGVADSCDLATGVSQDCDDDGVPDECLPCTEPCHCNDLNPCTFDQCAGGVCSHVPNAFGDVDFNQTVNLFDLFCLLDGFGGTFAGNCTAERVDIEPCDGNGVVNLFDLFVLLDVFGGMDPCCSPSPDSILRNTPGPAIDRTANLPAATIKLVASQRSARAGDRVWIDIFAGPVTNLRGYQIALAVAGGSRGSLEPTALAVHDNREDYMFARMESVHAEAPSGVRVVGTSMAGGVTTRRDTYMGSFAFRIPSDAHGTFAISIRPEETILVDTAGRQFALRPVNSVKILVR